LSAGESWFFVCVGIVCLVGGVRAMKTRQATTRSKGGHVRRYVGTDAVWQGVWGIVVGGAILAFGIVHLV
jgi:hypothetical protein